jgi:valyl-tRNA synthetase
VGRVESITVLANDSEAPAAATALLGDLQLLVPMKGVIDVDAERARLEKQMDKARADLKRTTGKLANEKFVNNAPTDVVTQERERAAEFEKTITQLTEQLVKLQELV